MLDTFAAREESASVVTIPCDPSLAWRYADQVLLMLGDGITQSGATRDILTAERRSALCLAPLWLVDGEGSVCFISR